MSQQLLLSIRDAMVIYKETPIFENLDLNIHHGLRNALIPIVTGIGGFLTVFFAGSLLIEVIFNKSKNYPFRITTGTVVLPDQYMFKDYKQ